MLKIMFIKKILKLNFKVFIKGGKNENIGKNLGGCLTLRWKKTKVGKKLGGRSIFPSLGKNHHRVRDFFPEPPCEYSNKKTQ